MTVNREPVFGPFNDPNWKPSGDQLSNLSKRFLVTHDDLQVEEVEVDGKRGNAITGVRKAEIDATKLHKCPRRAEGVPRFMEDKDDVWTTDNRCSFCGSMHPNDFLDRVKSGEKLTPTDKSYKAYLGDGKFYFQHLDANQQAELITLVNEKKINFGMPGHFYVLPFFAVAVEKAHA